MTDNAALLAAEAAAFKLPKVTLDDAWRYALAEYESAKAIVEGGRGGMYRDRMAACGAVLRLIESCLSSAVIKDELRRLAAERARDAKAAVAEDDAA